RARKTCSYRGMRVLSNVLAWLSASSPSRPSERTRKLRRRKHGTTGRLALPHQLKNELLRPSVQLPAGTHGCRALYGFWPPRQGQDAETGAEKRPLGAQNARKPLSYPPLGLTARPWAVSYGPNFGHFGTVGGRR